MVIVKLFKNESRRFGPYIFGPCTIGIDGKACGTCKGEPARGIGFRLPFGGVLMGWGRCD